MFESFEIVLSTEQRLVAHNLNDYKERLEAYLSSLSQVHETDDDFILLGEEIKTLRNVEKQLKEKIESAKRGDQAVSEIIDFAETLRKMVTDERLKREKIEIAQKERIKNEVVSEAVQVVLEHIQGLERSSMADEVIYKLYREIDLKNRFIERGKGSKTLDGYKRKIGSELQVLIAEGEIDTWVKTANVAFELIQDNYGYLFPAVLRDVFTAKNPEAVAVIVRARIVEEDRRRAEAEQAIAQQEQEQEQEQSVAVVKQLSSASAPDPVVKQSEPKAELPEEIGQYWIAIPMTATRAEAINELNEVRKKYPEAILRVVK